jgi:hypothetical protein
MTHPSSILRLLTFFEVEDLPSAFDGLLIHRLGSLARNHGLQWKVAPDGRGRNAELFELSLSAHNLHLYSREGNLAARKNGTRMLRGVLNSLKADDYVVTLDLRYETAAAIDSGGVELQPVEHEDELEDFRSDAIRGANFVDTLRVSTTVMTPRFAAWSRQ